MDTPLKLTVAITCTHQLVDGKPNPNAADFVSWKKIDDYTYEQTNKFEGKTLTVARHVISKDGKTRIHR